MNKNLSKLNKITAALIAVVLFLSMSWSIYLFMTADFNLYDNKIRLLVSEQKNAIEDGIYQTGNYPYLVIGIDGEVLYREQPFEEKVGDKVAVQEMVQFDQSFHTRNKEQIKESFVLQKNGTTSGFVIFLVPSDEIMQLSQGEQGYDIFFPAALGILLSLLIVTVRTLYCNKCILHPLREISQSAKGIIAGNYNLEVIRVFGRKIGENEVGELTFSFELMRDELKEKQMREEALKKSQQELVSCISHDLKTPISTIKAYSEGLRDHIAKTPEKEAEYVKIIINKTDLLIGMIEELLEYSNAELKQLDIKKEELYFHSYFEPLMKELQIYVKQKGINFFYETSIPETLVYIDKKRITEVMYNLIENSMKYRKEKAGQIDIQVERNGQFLMVKVIDNGIGISADDIPYVFDKFYRAEKSRSSSVPGSGLGLSICKYIINEHEGEIYCKSKLNNGCEIGFSLRL